MAKRNNKEIVELSEREHLVRRPGMYIGQVSPSEEDILLIQSDNKLKKQNIIYSVGFYKCFIEILDNALDEAKRLNGKMTKIQVYFNSKTSEVKVADFGEGFYKGQEINIETGLNKIETAVSRLRAGSNFFNEESEESLIGTNGVGSSVVNMLSEKFTIESVNIDGWFFREWLDFERTEFQPDKKERRKELGTTVSFIPLKEVFKDGQIWNKQIIHTFMTFKQWLVKNTEKTLSNLKFECYFDDEKLDLDIDFLPKERVEIKTKIGTVVIFEHYDGSDSASFINSAQCTGIHQKIVNDHINDNLKYHLGHHYYECFTALNFLPKLVRFADQNKTKFASGRWEINEIMIKEVLSKIDRHFIGSDLYKRIAAKIEDVNRAQTIKNIKSAKKNSKVKFSDKYTPPSDKNKIIFLTEGNSAAGGVLQKREPQIEGVYALKGKVKNCQTLSDLSTNTEIIDLMNILDLEVDSPKGPSFEKVIIATDPDCLHYSTKVMTQAGIKRMSELTYEDKMLTHNNIFKPIVKILEKETSEYIEISVFVNTFKCTPEHQWPIQDADGKYLVKQAKDILISDKIGYNSLCQPTEKFTWWTPINYIKHIKCHEREIFIDIEVEDDHTFYVIDNKETKKFLTHNCDGHHISSLLINTFTTWFPHLVEKGHLYILAVPLVSLDVGKIRKYFYKYEDYQDWIKVNTSYNNLRYLKGLGSLDERDWDYVLKTNRVLFQVYKDRSANKMLDIAFNGNAHGRKQWLKDEIR